MARPARIRVDTLIDAAPSRVWEQLRDISSHVKWMEDAVAITFRTDQRTGVGTAFDCITRVGPVKLTDVMEITEWQDEEVMGVRHTGLVQGAGRFRLEPAAGGRTRFSWEEQLVFPWWLGGSIGGLVGAPILKRIWKKNLRNLAASFS